MRKIKIYTDMQSGLVEKNVQANTWGELKNALEADGIFASDMKGMVRELRTSFESDSAVLPTNLGKDTNGVVSFDFTLFLTTVKTKSGKKSIKKELEDTEKEFANYIYSIVKVA